MQLALEMRQLFNRPLDLFGKLLPLRQQEGNSADGLRGLDLRAVQFRAEAPAHALVTEGGRFQFLLYFLLFLVQDNYIGEELLQLAAPFGVRKRTFVPVA